MTFRTTAIALVGGKSTTLGNQESRPWFQSSLQLCGGHPGRDSHFSLLNEVSSALCLLYQLECFRLQVTEAPIKQLAEEHYQIWQHVQKDKLASGLVASIPLAQEWIFGTWFFVWLFFVFASFALPPRAAFIFSLVGWQLQPVWIMMSWKDNIHWRRALDLFRLPSNQQTLIRSHRKTSVNLISCS